MPGTPENPLFFPTPADFREWLEEHHATHSELWVGFHKKGTGRASITWPESVDEALCCGWIDGVRKRVDEFSYTIRFTPRKPESNWSAVNIGRVEALTAEGRMRPGGLEAFARRTTGRSRVYSFEQRNDAIFSEDLEQLFRASEAAWNWFRAQAPWYQRTATFWVVSAKREETRRRRLTILIESSGKQQNIPALMRPAKG